MEVQGTVVRVSNVKPLVTTLCFSCSFCQTTQALLLTDGKYALPTKVKRRFSVGRVLNFLLGVGRRVPASDIYDVCMFSCAFSVRTQSAEARHLYLRGAPLSRRPLIGRLSSIYLNIVTLYLIFYYIYVCTECYLYTLSLTTSFLSIRIFIMSFDKKRSSLK